MNVCISFGIDGVLNNYPECWVNYVNGVTKCDYDSKTEIKQSISMEEYNRHKDRYRKSNYKANLPVDSKMVEEVNSLSKSNKDILIVTSRPINETSQYPKLRDMTKEWLDKNDIPYDEFGVKDEIFSDNCRVDYHIEDEVEDAVEIANFGVDVLLIGSTFNDVSHDRISYVEEPADIKEKVRT